MSPQSLSNSELFAPVPIGLVANLMLERGWKLATAESCTGGMIAAACTDLAGSSNWFECGWVSYSNAAKTDLLGVDAATIDTHGAVSEPVARAMAAGALARSAAQVAIAVTGIAGPGGATDGKPVGLVWFGFGLPGGVQTEMQCFSGDRAAVRASTVRHALARLHQLLQTAA